MANPDRMPDLLELVRLNARLFGRSEDEVLAAVTEYVVDDGARDVVPLSRSRTTDPTP